MLRALSLVFHDDDRRVRRASVQVFENAPIGAAENFAADSTQVLNDADDAVRDAANEALRSIRQAAASRSRVPAR